MIEDFCEATEVTDQLFSFPELEPLTRLYVQDSLRINTERWQIAHNYHRRRQNLHYQALWEPGIVCGLGVKTIPPPQDVTSQFRDSRWIEIQPGIAIDMEGNPIVLSPEEDRTYRIAAPAPIEGTRLVHVVVRYVDPDNLEVDVQSDRVIERFRFDQRIGQLRDKDIEVCRIALAPGETILKVPEDPFRPNLNELDLRYRHQAQMRPSGCVHLGTITPLNNQKLQQWQRLTDSFSSLTKAFQGRLTPTPIDPVSIDSLSAYDLIYVSGETLLHWQAESQTREWETLRQYLQLGGFLYVDTLQLDSALPTLQTLLSQLTPEALQPLSKDHRIRKMPFHFGPLPTLGEQAPVSVQYGGGVLLTHAKLAAAWSSDDLPRDQIRSAQELGINIVHLAWQRSQFQQLFS